MQKSYNLTYQTHLPAKKMSTDQILEIITGLNQNYDTTNQEINKAHFTGSVYSTESEVVEMNSEIFKIFCYANCFENFKSAL
mgnify:CR=1 FL=1